MKGIWCLWVCLGWLSAWNLPIPSPNLLLSSIDHALGPVLCLTCPTAPHPYKAHARKLYTTADFTQANYYDTTSAVQVGVYIIYLTRGPLGLLISQFDTELQKWVKSKEFPGLNDADWGTEAYYGTICIAAMNLKMYVHARAYWGSNIWEYDPETGSLSNYYPSTFLTDAVDSFTTPKYYKTIRMAAVGSLLYVSARGLTCIRLASFNPATLAWTVLSTFTETIIMTTTLWDYSEFYSTFRMVSQGNSLWFFVRGPEGLNLFSYNTLSASWHFSIINSSTYYVGAIWSVAKHTDTFHLVASANGVYVTARGSEKMVTVFYNVNTATLSPVVDRNYYTDAAGWDNAEYYKTVALTSCGGDTVILSGRGSTTLEISRLIDQSSGLWIVGTSQPSFTNAAGWDQIYKYWTLKAVCVDNYLYMVGRNLHNLEMVRYSISSDTWTIQETISSKTCSTSCQVCIDTSVTDCTYCYPHAHLSSTSPSSCVCDSGYFPDPGENHCTPICHPTCLACSGPSNQDCTSCNPNADLMFPPTSSCQCNNEFYLNSANSCLPCDSQCLHCTGAGPNQCSVCKNNAVLQANSCQCMQSFYMNTRGICVSCHPSCKTCSDAFSCLSCFVSAQLSNLICECSPGYFPQPDYSHCTACSSQCVVCQSTEKCEKCGSNAVLITGLCYCSEGYYGTSEALNCVICPPGCSSCNAETCLKCLLNWYLFEKQCTQTCPAGMVVREEKCVEASPEPSLNVHPNNTLALSFSKPLTKVILIADVDIQVNDLESSYNPTWNITSLVEFTSYLIDLHFVDSNPHSYSNATLAFLSPSALHDLTGNSLTKLTLSASLHPFSSLPTPSERASTPAAQAAAATSQGAVAGAAVSSLFGGSPVGLFSLLNQLQLITYINFINVTLPEDLANTLQGLSMSSILITPFGYIYDENKAKEAPDFAKNSGYTSTLFLLNANSLVLASCTALLGYFSFSLLSHMPGSEKVRIYFSELRSEYHWSVPLRLWLQLYLDVGVAALLQFDDFSWGQYGVVTNGVAAGLFLCAFVVTPLAVPVFMIMHEKELLKRTDPAFNKRWGTLFMEFRCANDFRVVAFYPYFLIRRCAYAMLLIYCTSSPVFLLLYSISASVTVRSN